MNYGNTLSLSLQYNSRLQVSRYEVPGKAAMEFHYTTPSGGVTDNDGRVKFMRDLTATNSRFDRLYAYDHVGRLTKAVTGPEARGGADVDARPFRQINVYDEWDNMTSRTGRHWSQGAGMPTAVINPSTNRNQAWGYDAAGNPTDQVDVQNTYDGAGWVTRVIDFEQRGEFAPGLTLDSGYDGGGQRVKHVENGSIKYYVRSSALGGQVVTELNQSGQALRGYVYMGGTLLAKHEGGAVQWLHTNPVTGSQTPTSAGGGSAGLRTELDPLGADVGTLDWYQFQRPARGPETHTPRYSGPVRLDLGCTLDYLPTEGCVAKIIFERGSLLSVSR